MTLTVRIDLDPVPASRPRVTKRGVFYENRYGSWRTSAAWLLPTQRPREVFKGPLAIVVESVCARPARAANPFPMGDVDNLAKGPMDIITSDGGYWIDDKQVVSLLSTKRFAAKGESPHTVVRIEAVDM